MRCLNTGLPMKDSFLEIPFVYLVIYVRNEQNDKHVEEISKFLNLKIKEQ
jgi:hypothetical protein